MFNTNQTPFTMDVVPAGSGNGNCNGNGMWGDGAMWLWIIIILFFAGNGWNNSGAAVAGATDNYVLASDFATLQRQIDSTSTNTNNLIATSSDQLQRQVTSIGNGISSLGYDQLNQINGVNQNISSTGYAITNAIQQNTIDGMQNTNALSTQIANCCCQTQQGMKDINYNIATQSSEISRGVERGFSDTNYNIATQANGITTAISNGFCQTNFNAQTNTRDIVDSQNAGTQAILAKLSQMEASAKDDKIAELQAMNSDLRLAASQQAQNNYLVSELGQKAAVPAYIVSNPYCNCNSCCSGCGC